MKKLEELGISPAPWMVLTVNGSLHSVEASPCFIGDLMHIATVCNMRKARPSDARLIAAAPELYEALEDCLFQLDAWVHGGRFAITESDLNAIAKAENALAKASGEAK